MIRSKRTSCPCSRALDRARRLFRIAARIQAHRLQARNRSNAPRDPPISPHRSATTASPCPMSPRAASPPIPPTADRAGPAGAGHQRSPGARQIRHHAHRACGQPALVVVGGTPGRNLWPQIGDFWLELGFILNIDSPEIGVMETDWAEDRAKIPQVSPPSIGKVLDGLFSTPSATSSAPASKQGMGNGHGGGHLAPRHDGNLPHRGQGLDDLAAASRRPPSSKGRDAASPDGPPLVPRRRVPRSRSPRRSRRSGAHRLRARRPGDAGDGRGIRSCLASRRPLRSTASVSPSRTATVRRVCTSCGTSIPDAGQPQHEKGFCRGWPSGAAMPNRRRWQSEYRLRVQGQGEGLAGQRAHPRGRARQPDTARRMLGLLREQLR